MMIEFNKDHFDAIAHEVNRRLAIYLKDLLEANGDEYPSNQEVREITCIMLDAVRGAVMAVSNDWPTDVNLLEESFEEYVGSYNIKCEYDEEVARAAKEKDHLPQTTKCEACSYYFDNGDGSSCHCHFYDDGWGDNPPCNDDSSEDPYPTEEESFEADDEDEPEFALLDTKEVYDDCGNTHTVYLFEDISETIIGDTFVIMIDNDKPDKENADWTEDSRVYAYEYFEEFELCEPDVIYPED